MRKVRLFLLVGIVLLAGGQSLFSRNKSGQEEKEKQIKELIDSKRYKIDVNRALPMRGQSISLSSAYSLELRGDSAVSYLPYYGVAYSAPYGGGDGLRFEESITDYSFSYNKKGTAQIKFVARTADDVYKFYTQIFPNGTATIQVTPVNKQGITFYGELAFPKDKE